MTLFVLVMLVLVPPYLLLLSLFFQNQKHIHEAVYYLDITSLNKRYNFFIKIIRNHSFIYVLFEEI
jgi:hypothetical protein